MTRSSANAPQFQRWNLSSKKETFGDDGDTSRVTSSLRQKKQGKHGFTRKCGRLVREQGARFYIIRRCVIMLLCWTDNSNHNKNYSDHS
ncbi:hypothetical protein BRARA_D00391 [Brassica rapa]|uniref:Uncharacterized protein n=2 Tax=Brassica TaxID=3705 RepID=A0A397ZIC7_BRACM|nr:hypothetical protein BRARA_D00391 [Brassica rapa]CAF2266754.1 unnamed protein product [Brassica napus]CAG7905585.1 unnamed protein product [Brassica rapa]VDD10822.1 unnamed protein product [Brassica rapa]